MKLKKILLLTICAAVLSINISTLTAEDYTNMKIEDSIEIPAVLIENSGIAEMDYDVLKSTFAAHKMQFKKLNNGNYKITLDNIYDGDVKHSLILALRDIEAFFLDKAQIQGGFMHITYTSDNCINIIADPITVYSGLMDCYRYAYADLEIELYLYGDATCDTPKKHNANPKHYVANIYDYKTGKLIWHKDIFKEKIVGDYNRNDPNSLNKFYNELEKNSGR